MQRQPPFGSLQPAPWPLNIFEVYDVMGFRQLRLLFFWPFQPEMIENRFGNCSNLGHSQLIYYANYMKYKDIMRD